MDSPSAPKAPDPGQTVNDQTNSNINTGIANSVLGNANVYSPLGSSTFKQTGWKMVDGKKVPQYSQTIKLSPAQKALLDQQQALGKQFNTIAGNQLTQAQGALSQPVDFSSLGDMPTADRGRYEAALMDRMNPQLERDRASMESKLANQGVMPGSEAYREAIALADRQANDARQQAILGGGTYAGQEIDQGLAIRNQGMNEMLTERTQPLNEVMAMMGKGQVSMPQFASYRGGTVNPTDVAGIQQQGFNNQMGLYNSQLNQQNAMLGGLAGLGGSLLSAPMTGGGSLAGSLFGGLGGF